MAERLSFDVLVIGSGASGLAAAVSAERAGARVALAAKGSLQSCNSAKAQGGIQAAFGDDDSPEQHAEDVWKSSHETADRRLVEVLTAEAPSAIHWLEELGVEFTRENGGYRLARCGGASRKRLLQVGDRTGHAITKALARGRRGRLAARRFAKSPLVSLEPRRERLARARRGEHVIDAGAVVLAAGGRCYREAEERGELSTNHPGATGEVTQIALELGAEARDLDALQYHPNGGAWPPNMQGYSIPETTRAYGAVAAERRAARSSPTRSGRATRCRRRSSTRSTQGRGVETPDGRPAVYLDTTRVPEHDAEISLPYMLRRYRAAGIDPLREPILTYPVLHYQNGGLVIDEHARDDGRGPVRLRRDRRRHARAQPDDGQLPARVLRVRPAGRARRRGEGGDEHGRDRSAAGRRGRRRAPLRLGAEGHPAGPARRARRGARARDLGPRPARARDDPQERRDRRRRERTSSARTPASPSTRAASASTSRCIRRGSTRR